MNVKQLQALRDKLGNDISVAIEKLINEFEIEAEIIVTNVSIDIHQIGSMGEPVRSVVGETSVSLDI